jgi:diguanylate cyclase (GGDEF)-like protein
MLLRGLLLLVLSIAVAVPAHAAELGVFPARTWGIHQIRLGDDYPDPPFYALAQSPDGLIYASDASGLLEFDGRDWRRIARDSKAAVIVLGVTRAGELVIGGGEYLHLMPDPREPDRFFDISEELAGGLHGSGDFWEFAEDDQQWCVRSPSLLVCKHADGFRSYRAQHGFGRMFQTSSAILIQVDGVGLSRVTAQGPQLIPGGDALKSGGLSSLVQFPDGRIAAVTGDPMGLWLWRGDEAPRLHARIAADALSMPVGIGWIVDGDRIALPEDHGGVAILDLEGQVRERIDPAALGLGTGAQALLVDREGALWVAWRTAVSRVEFPSRMRVFPLPPSMFGQSRSVTRTRFGITSFHGGDVLVLQQDAASNRWEFRQQGPTLPSIISIVSSNGTDFAGTILGLWSLDDGRQLMPRELVFATAAVLDHPDSAWVGMRKGVARMDRVDGKWIATPDRAEISFEVISILQREQHELWLGSLVGRVARVHLGGGLSLADARVDEFDQASGLPRAALTLETIGDKFMVWAQGGSVYEFQDGAFQPSATLPLEETGEINEIKQIDERQVVVSSPGSRLRLLQRDITGVYRHQPSVFDDIVGIEKTRSLHVDPDGTVWLAKDSGLVRIDPARPAPKPAPQRVVIRDASIGEVSLLPDRGTSAPLTLEEGADLRVSYLLPSYRAPELNRFRSRIRGAGATSEWSSWSNETRRDFTNLPAGELRFEVEAEDAAGHSGGIAALPITVIAPWYRRGWALALFVLGGALLVLVAVQWRLRALRARGIELERLVAMKTDALLIAANTDPLTGLWNRHRFGHWVRNELLDINVRAGIARADEAVDLIVCVIDLDHFKRINDQHGHAAGDQVLKAVAERLQASKRPQDLIFRFGGEEFVYLATQRHRDEGRQLAEAIVREIAQTEVELDGGVRLDPTASVGWTAYPFYRERADLFSIDFVLGVADRALYLAKQGGRNRACGYLPNLAVDDIDRTQADWRSQAFDRHPDFLRQV